MCAAAEAGGAAVVIGGGLLGLEAAYGLAAARHGGHRRPPDGRADGAPARPAAGFLLTEALDERGVEVLAGPLRGDPRRDRQVDRPEARRTAGFCPATCW